MDYKFFREIQPERGIHGNFASGQINYRWKTASNTAWVPSQSYIKLKMTITNDTDTQLQDDDDIGLNMMVCDQLFQQMDMRINGVLVSQMNDYIAQCASLKCRMKCDMDKRESLLSSVNYTKIDLVDRIAQISSDGRLQKDTVWNKGVQLAANAASGTQLNFLDLGTPHQVEFVNAIGNNRVVFSRNDSEEPIPDMSEYFSVGDYIYLNDGAEIATWVTGFVTTVTTNDTIVVTTVNNNVAAADLINQVRVHDRYYIDRKYSNSVQNNQFELIWKPPLGFFDINTEVSGDFKFELTPNPEGVWQRYAIESLRESKILGDDYKIEVIEANMYLWTHVHHAPINDQQTFVYTDMRCSSQNLTTKSLTSKVFNIHPYNHSLTIAWQDSACTNDTRFSRAKFKIVGNQELDIRRFYIQMDGITLPDPLPSPEHSLGVNELYQRYVENFHYSGAFNSSMTKYETMEEWIRAGIYFHYKWGTGYKKTGQANVYSSFDQSVRQDWLGEDNDRRNPQILLFDHYYCTLKMVVKDGELISIEKM